MDNPQNTKADLALFGGAGLAKSLGTSALRSLGVGKKSIGLVGLGTQAALAGGTTLLSRNRLMQGAENAIKGTEAAPVAELIGNMAASATLPVAFAAPSLGIKATKSAISAATKAAGKVTASGPVRSVALMGTAFLDSPAATGMSVVEADMVARATRTTQVAPTQGTSIRSSAPNTAQPSVSSNVGE